MCKKVYKLKIADFASAPCEWRELRIIQDSGFFNLNILMPIPFIELKSIGILLAID